MIQAKKISSFSEIESDEICYYHTPVGWMLYHPECGLGNLRSHKVVEHQDGTITVSPSILIQTKNKGRKVSVHGYLEKGMWRDC